MAAGVLPLWTHWADITFAAEFRAPGRPRKPWWHRRRFTFGTGLYRCPDTVDARGRLGDDAIVKHDDRGGAMEPSSD